MSSLNVRFAQKTRGKTDLLNCTNLPASDSARHNHKAGAGPIAGGITAEPTPVCVTGCLCRDKIRRKQEGLQQDCAEQDRWGEAADYEKVTSM